MRERSDDLLRRQRAVLDAVRAGASPSRLVGAWTECEAACRALEERVARDGLDDATRDLLARARALAGLLAHELESKRAEVAKELADVRRARRRLREIDRNTGSSGASCDVQG
ncbi:MAG: hypothetical protein R3F34_05355 [Planctomycetota bacterium]